MSRPRSARVAGSDAPTPTRDSPARTLASHAVLSGPKKFQAVLAARPCARSQHFHVHHLPVPAAGTRGSATPADPLDGVVANELSTGSDVILDMTVDGRQWRLGLVVPKRHAKRAVTRSLLKRRMRMLWLARLVDMPAGDWLVRLTSPIDRKLWPSAASAPLAEMVTTELMAVLDDAVRRARRGPQPPKRPQSTPTVPAPGGSDVAKPSA